MTRKLWRKMIMKPFGETARETRAKASELAEKTAENARLTAEAAKARIQDGYGRARAATEDLAAKASEPAGVDRKSDVEGTSVSVRVDHGGSRIMNKQKAARTGKTR